MYITEQDKKLSLDKSKSKNEEKENNEKVRATLRAYRPFSGWR